MSVLEPPHPVAMDRCRQNFNVVFPSEENFGKATTALHAGWYYHVLGPTMGEQAQPAQPGNRPNGQEPGHQAPQPPRSSHPTEELAESRQKPLLLQAIGPKHVALGVRILAKARNRVLKAKTKLPEFACVPAWFTGEARSGGAETNHSRRGGGTLGGGGTAEEDGGAMRGINIQFVEL